MKRVTAGRAEFDREMYKGCCASHQGANFTATQAAEICARMHPLGAAGLPPKAAPALAYAEGAVGASPRSSPGNAADIFPVPRGYTVDPERLGTHLRALALQKANPALRYLEAVRKVGG